LPQADEQLPAVDAREHAVEHDAVVIGLSRLRQALLAILRGVDGVQLLAQPLAQTVEEQRVVFDAEESHGVEGRRSWNGSGLLMPQRFDRIERRRAPCGHESEKDADGGREDKGDEVDLRIEDERRADDFGEPQAESVGERDATKAADARKGHGFNEELEHYFARTGADGHADADFSG